jgi:regulator of sirC expression with transglutaminase-like and TPR domain
MNNPSFDMPEASDRFTTTLQKHPFDEVPLDLAALVIGRSFCGEVDLTGNLMILDSLAEEASHLAGSERSPEALVEALCQVLFTKHGYRGNHENYYAPENSFLHHVLSTHKGIPISLSLLMIEVGRRLELPLVGIGLPCHFMTGFLSSAGTRYFDPFHGGLERTREQCIEMIRSLSEGKLEVSASHFVPLPKNLFLTRMLCNLRSIYRQRRDHHHLVTTLHHLLQLNPEDNHLHLELAMSLVEIGDLGRAKKYYKQSLEIGCGVVPLALKEASRKLKQVFALMN